MKKTEKNNSEVPLKELYQAFAELQNAEEIEKFLQDLCTPAELQAMGGRWQVVDLLEADKPYWQIHEQTGVSMTTITRVARCIRFGNGGYQIARDRLKGKQDGNNT